ncbi:MAG TPA: LCP family protein [Candidatus Saccharimonadales bacterium]|nr:LCP family protein [Candidatus Saccharimonadales bacterium]
MSKRLLKSSRTRKRIGLLLSIAVIIIAGFFLFRAAQFSPFVFQLVFNRNINLKTTDSRVNILLLGIGGGAHEGPNLSDTVIFASIDPAKQNVTLVSIPRDLWVPDINGKINTAYALGEEKKTGSGLPLAEAVVSKITGQQVDYGVRIDFNGFIKAVDMMEGIDVTVANTFDDYAYPIEGKEDESCGKSPDELKLLATASADLQLEQLPCRYKHIHFDKGTEHMDGQTALEFVRSRHALGVEGSDFARSRRQAAVISAVKSKVFSVGTLLNPAKVLSLYNILKDSIDTDIKQDEFDDFIRLAQKLKNAKIQSTVIDQGDSSQSRLGLLVNPPPTADTGFAWFLAPRIGNGDFSEIQKYVLCEIQVGNCIVAEKGIATPTPSVAPSLSPSPKK